MSMKTFLQRFDSFCYFRHYLLHRSQNFSHADPFLVVATVK